MMITGTQTIAQFKIAQWVEENFQPNSVTIDFTGSNRAIITDSQGKTMKLRYVQTTGVVEDKE